MRSNPLFRKMFGDSFPSSSNLAIDLCNRGGLTNDSKLIHLGCGTGGVSSLLYSRFNCQIMGVDPSAQLIDIANSESARGSLSFDNSPLHKTPFSNSGATHILSEANLSIYQQPTLLFDEIKRCLGSNGMLLNSELVITDSSLLDERVNKFLSTSIGSGLSRTLDNWKMLLRENGFEIIETQMEPSIMRSNGKKFRRALMGLNLLRRTKQFSFSDFGLSSLEDDFDSITKSTLSAINDGIITYASFISQPI
ncbi:MAG: hypothetical protein CMA77_02760 [Euryarchaeota archaeon]|nr:hypothetical protein [Euryarchaeota archaeon]